MTLNKHQKQLMIIGAAALTLILLYRYYQSRQANAATAGATGGGTAAPDTSSSDYASLAGQEQSDAAALQGQNQQLSGQEQSDVAALNAALTGQGAQETSDVSGLQGLIDGISAQIAAIPQTVTGAAPPPAPHPTDPRAPRLSTVPRGYIAAPFGHTKPKAPPGVRVVGLGHGNWGYTTAPVSKPKAKPHPAAPHHRHIAHPNPDHAQRGNVHTPNRPRLPQPAKPKPRTRTRPSGRRK